MNEDSSESKQHPQAEILRLIADGEKVVISGRKNEKSAWIPVTVGHVFRYPKWQFKFETKPAGPIVRWKWALRSKGEWYESQTFKSEEEAKVYGGAAICLEYTRTEFPE